MKSFEIFKYEVQILCDIYNKQDHRACGNQKMTLKPIFGDFSSDGYMPKYVANFIIYYDGKSPYKSRDFVEYNCRFGNCASGWSLPLEIFYFKTLRGAFKKIFCI